MNTGQRATAGLVITSPANPRVKHAVALRHRRTRDNAGVTLAEGYAEIALATSAGAVPHTLYLCPELAGDDPQGLAERVAEAGGEVVRVSP
ncbi:MAG TPA: hypothetical protein VGS19_04775, partial [Streptosporangiaceae bacterium]|nr:hypothetical protein [Streptosporangiaceae bacterium]